MKKAEETLIQACRDAGFTDEYSKAIFKINPDTSSAYIDAIKEYAQEAIKADRENVAKHAKAVGPLSQTTSRNRPYVDKDSIFNAPQIELK